MIGITGANGKLGHLVIGELLRTVPAAEIVAIVRTPAKAASLAQQGITVRQGDYNAPDTLGPALADIDRLLLISSNEIGRRVAQHRAVIAAAKLAGVGLIAYTSLLHARTSPLALRQEHVQTEDALAEAGVPYALLRNSWYTENYTGALADALKRGEIVGASGDGRISAAARADYAAAAAAVLVASDDRSVRVYELAGDSAFTMSDFAAEVARQSGKAVAYRNLSASDYQAALIAGGLPERAAAGMAATHAGTAQGALFDDGRQLSRLIGRPTTPWAQTIATALSLIEE